MTNERLQEIYDLPPQHRMTALLVGIAALEERNRALEEELTRALNLVDLSQTADTIVKLREALTNILKHVPHSQLCDSYTWNKGWNACDCWRREAEAALEATK